MRIGLEETNMAAIIFDNANRTMRFREQFDAAPAECHERARRVG
jgi:hypothetical protein